MNLPSAALQTPAGRFLAAAAARELASGSTGPWVVAFSGGPDSLALAVALAGVDSPAIHLVHVDHGLDVGSGDRARRAVELARALELPITVLERDVRSGRRSGENLEAAARRIRYAALDGARSTLGADRIVTAHHRDDQVETILMRIASGSGVLGLAGIRERRGALWRPALGLSRAELGAVIAASGLEPLRDPTNADLVRQRNRIRLALLPHLRRTEPGLDAALAALALRASGAREALTRRLEEIYDVERTDDGAQLLHAALRRYSPSLNLFALQRLENLAGFATASSTRSRSELLRQLQEAKGGRLPGFAGRRWRLREGRLELAAPGPAAEPTPPFSYTLAVPGEVTVPELGGRMRLRRAAVEAWMRRGEPDRAALRFPGPIPATSLKCEVRNRRPGDRLRPLGAPGMRSLRELFIDRKVERSERDRIPLLVVEDRVAWVPGLTIDDGLRLAGDEVDCWVAEWLPEGVPSGGGRT